MEYLEFDVYKKDGYIYNPNHPKRKWFSTLNNFRIWEGIFNDIPKLEERRWKISIKVRNIIKNIWKPFIEKMKDIRICYGYHKNGNWVQISYEINQFNEPDVNMNWVNLEPKENINQEIADEYFAILRKHDRYCKYLRLFNYCFDKAINKKYLESKSILLHLIINNRDYWFQEDFSKYREQKYILIDYPENILKEQITEKL